MKKIIPLSLFLIAIFPVTAAAIPIVYSAAGSVYYDVYANGEYQGYEEADIQGHVTIDDDYDFVAGPTPFIHYYLLNFNLSTQYDSWVSGSSNAGELLIEFDMDMWFGDALLWGFSNGDGSIDFLAADGTNLGRSIDSASTLPPLIALNQLGIISSNATTFPTHANLLLTKTASIPEPSVLALLGLGLVGLAFVFHKKS
ncbi:MAG: PEP-CTERM sorting domain-containing protein [Gammaproteobacteria bacterium]|nr:PEP-CTERM sorting domain-containing protein [Gammaproteobacteria bacterium]